MATYNIRDGCQGGLYSAAKALRKGRVDVAVVQETKITEAKFAARKFRGYDIRVTPPSDKTAAGLASSCGRLNIFLSRM